MIISNFYCTVFTPTLEKKLLWPHQVDGIKKAFDDGKIKNFWIPIAPMGWWPENK